MFNDKFQNRVPLQKPFQRPRDPRLNRPQNPIKPSEPPKSAPKLWSGQIEIPDDCKVGVSMFLNSKSNRAFKDDLPERLVIKSRISPRSTLKFVNEFSNSINKLEVVLVSFQPSSDAEKENFLKLINFLKEMERCGIVGGVTRSIKDFYLYPLSPAEAIPSILSKFFEDPVSFYPSPALLGILFLSPLVNQPSIPVMQSKPVVTKKPFEPKIVRDHNSFNSFAPGFRSLSDPSVRAIEPFSYQYAKKPPAPKKDYPKREAPRYSATPNQNSFESFYVPSAVKKSNVPEYVPNSKRKYIFDDSGKLETTFDSQGSLNYEPDYVKLSSKAKMQSINYLPVSSNSVYEPAYVSTRYASTNYVPKSSEDNSYVPQFVRPRDH